VKPFLIVLVGVALAGVAVGGYLWLSEDNDDGSYPTRRIDPAAVKRAKQAIGTALGLRTGFPKGVNENRVADLDYVQTSPTEIRACLQGSSNAKCLIVKLQDGKPATVEEDASAVPNHVLYPD
jgi:hypothetical protein